MIYSQEQVKFSLNKYGFKNANYFENHIVCVQSVIKYIIEAYKKNLKIIDFSAYKFLSCNYAQIHLHNGIFGHYKNTNKNVIDFDAPDNRVIEDHLFFPYLKNYLKNKEVFLNGSFINKDNNKKYVRFTLDEEEQPDMHPLFMFSDFVMNENIKQFYFDMFEKYLNPEELPIVTLESLEKDLLKNNESGWLKVAKTNLENVENIENVDTIKNKNIANTVKTKTENIANSLNINTENFEAQFSKYPYKLQNFIKASEKALIIFIDKIINCIKIMNENNDNKESFEIENMPIEIINNTPEKKVTSNYYMKILLNGWINNTDYQQEKYFFIDYLQKFLLQKCNIEIAAKLNSENNKFGFTLQKSIPSVKVSIPYNSPWEYKYYLACQLLTPYFVKSDNSIKTPCVVKNDNSIKIKRNNSHDSTISCNSYNSRNSSKKLNWAEDNPTDDEDENENMDSENIVFKIIEPEKINENKLVTNEIIEPIKTNEIIKSEIKLEGENDGEELKSEIKLEGENDGDALKSEIDGEAKKVKREYNKELDCVVILENTLYLIKNEQLQINIGTDYELSVAQNKNILKFYENGELVIVSCKNIFKK